MNYMKQVADMLGIEINEEFKLVYPDGKISKFSFAITDNGLWRLDGNSLACNDILRGVLTGEYQIKKMLWKPIRGQEYYMPSIEDGHPDFCGYTWSDNRKCNERYNSGLVCRTTDEAVEKAKKILELLAQQYI